MAKTSIKPDFTAVFSALRALMAAHAAQLIVSADNAAKYTLLTKSPSPFPQHKGQPMWFGEVRLGKAYVSLHLMAIYMNEALTKTISPALKKHMQGKSCFNFKQVPSPELLAELNRLTAASVAVYAKKQWL